jgi:hypothetical protein
VATFTNIWLVTGNFQEDKFNKLPLRHRYVTSCGVA